MVKGMENMVKGMEKQQQQQGTPKIVRAMGDPC